MNENGHKSPSEFEAARNRLRACWELASVFNFLKVFVPIIGSELKMSAEEIETSLIIPDRCLRLIHIVLLKGIPPVSKNLKDPDAWVVTLSKKLFMWWPWVAEGDFPLTAAKGLEMETYKNLDPTVRLVILRALCEIRADQHDVIAYINDAVKIKNEISTFRKMNIGEDGKGTSYWLDGNETIGLRLYKEVNALKENVKPPSMSCQWETLATNLEEFQKVVFLEQKGYNDQTTGSKREVYSNFNDKAEYSSSASKLEVAVSAVVETEAIPVLNKLFKKKQRELEKKMNEERILNNFSRSGITRSCRNRKSITYTFDEYDKVISEAIRENKRMKTKDEEKSGKKETLVKDDPMQAGEVESIISDENDVCEDSGEELDKNVASEDSGKESDKNDVSEGSGEGSEENDVSKDFGEESDANDVSENSGEESDANDVSEDSGEESDEDVSEGAVEDSVDVSEDAVEDSDDVSEDAVEDSDEDDRDNKENMNFNSSKNGKPKSRSQQRIVRKETHEDGESTESEPDSENSELETKDISENEDGKKENKNGSKENGVHSVQKMKHFGTKKRLVQRPNRNTAIESAVVSDSEDESDN